MNTINNSSDKREESQSYSIYLIIVNFWVSICFPEINRLHKYFPQVKSVYDF